MTDDTVAAAGEVAPGEEAADGEAPSTVVPKKGLSGKKLVLFIALPVVVLALVAGGGFAFGLFDAILGGEEAHGEKENLEEGMPKSAAFFDVPEMLVNLNAEGRKTHFLKLTVAFELERTEDIDRIQAVLPRIVDNFQVYLRELRVEDLRGAAGLHRLREELLIRVNAAARPAKVNDVLFKEMLVQ